MKKYERRIADLLLELARLKEAYSNVCDSNRALQAEIVELEAEMDAWRQKAYSLLMEQEQQEVK